MFRLYSHLICDVVADARRAALKTVDEKSNLQYTIGYRLGRTRTTAMSFRVEFSGRETRRLIYVDDFWNGAENE